MNTATFRSELHDIIDAADDEHLEALYSLLKTSSDEHFQPEEEDLAEAYRRRDQYLKGKSKAYTLEESIQMLKEITGRDLRA